MKVDSWVCPHCLQIHTELDKHIVHLHRDNRCFLQSLNYGRKAGMCKCWNLKECRCMYRVNSRG